MPAQRRSQPSVSLTSQVTIPDTVLFQDLEGEAVLLNLATGTYFSLDPVGTRTWHLLQQHGRLQPVLAKLCEEFDVDQACCRTDLLQLVSALYAHGLLQPVPESAATSSP